MGYKRAGCTIVAANDIDPEMAWHYQHNLSPPAYFLCPIGDLLNRNLPSELFELDILDGSPPCSTFSMAGSREDAWGKEKHFREGQAKQVLSDLFFDYLSLVERLKPRVAIAENVKGMILGNAKGYTKLVMQRFREIGYMPQLFLLNAADCGVPQRRERVFFVAQREDMRRPALRLQPKHRWISAGEACRDLMPEEQGLTLSALTERQWQKTPEGESLAVGVCSLTGKRSRFNEYRLSSSFPANALSAQSQNFITGPRLADWPLANGNASAVSLTTIMQKRIRLGST